MFVCAGQLLLGKDLPWSVIDTHSDTLLEETDFPLPVSVNYKEYDDFITIAL